MPEFSSKAIGRIQRAVKTVEALPQRHGQGVGRSSQGFKPFFALLTSTYSSGYNSSGYSWNYCEVEESGSLTARSTWGDSTADGKGFHILGNQQIPSGELVEFVTPLQFRMVDMMPRRAVTSSTITAGAGDGTTYGTGTVSTYGTVRNYYSSSIDSGKLVYIIFTGTYCEVITEDCTA